MEHFSEEHSNNLLSKTWLAKTDNQSSTPYLFKFGFSSVDLSCCVLLTDTKSVWAEVLTSNQFSRRWREFNPGSPPLYADAGVEDTWRASTLELLSRAHTPGGISDLAFEAGVSHFSDRTFQLEGESFKWQWETCYIGHKLSAEVISKHLIFPLISVNHLAFSVEGLGGLSDDEIEKVVDKMGRTARRTLDTHIRNAMSKPRVSTILRRMTAMFNFVSDLPPITSTAEKPDLRPKETEPVPEIRSITPIKQRLAPRPSPVHPHSEAKVILLQDDSPLNPPIHTTNSATESEGEETILLDKSGAISDPSPNLNSLSRSLEPLHHGSTKLAGSVVQAHSNSRAGSSKPASDSDSSPPRPAVKKVKKSLSSSDEDSTEERKGRISQAKGSAGKAKRGTRQPIQRGGKRF